MMGEGIGWYHPIDESDQWDGFNEPGIEHFAGNPLLHVAREVNQNSYDAGDGQIVKVSMRLLYVDVNSIPGLDELRNTIQLCKVAAENESPKAEQFFATAEAELKKGKISVLEISDFNTKGMRGPAMNGTPYYAFMKAKGQSRKDSETATGSFGIGKFAPYVVSKLRTVFVSTVFQSADGAYQQLTQGKSILMSHDNEAGKRLQGTGFWGIRERCHPVEGISDDIPTWVQRATSEEELAQSKGTKLTILGFDDLPDWQVSLAASVAENFFGAINAGKLIVDIDDGKYLLNQQTIKNFFADTDSREKVSKHSNEPDQFDDCGRYLACLQTGSEVIVEESENLHLGLCELRILLGEGLPKKVCVLRNGMFISDSLPLYGLKHFSDFKEFIAVVECKNKKGIELLRSMEPPRHDGFEPNRLPTKSEKKKGEMALRHLANWIRDMLKRHAKDPVSDVTTLDELKEYFADENGEGEGKGTGEIDPNGKIIIRAKPVKQKAPSTPNTEGEAIDGNEGEGGGGNDGGGQGDGRGGKGPGEGGEGSEGGSRAPKQEIILENVRAIISGKAKRRVSVTPATTGQLALSVMEAGADHDYAIAIVTSDKGVVQDGNLIVDATANNRLTLELGLAEEFNGSLKVVAHEV